MEMATKYETPHPLLDRLNALLRGELTAMTTYRRAAEEQSHYALRALEEEHREAAEALREHIAALGGQPAENTGIWGVWARAVEGLAKRLGRGAQALALREGEEHGIRTYENALLEDELDPETRALIQSHLLPKAQAHLSVLHDCFEINPPEAER